MLDFTVAICTCNGSERLPKVLEKLRSQILTQPIQWEVIIIDNNSKDQTATVIQQNQQSWPESIPLSYYFESRQGLGFARQKAIDVSQGTFVGFLDDDNLPGSNWVQEAYQFGIDHPQVAIYAGKIDGVYEVSPPANFERISRFLAIGGAPQPFCYNDHSSYALPPGAGSVVRRSVWLDCVPKRLKLQGRMSGLNLPGDDIEAFMHIRNAGWEVWYTPSLKIEHLIPKERLNRQYLLNLMWGVGLSRTYTRSIGLSAIQTVLMVPLFFANDLRKLIRHLWKNPTLNDTVTLCEIKLFIGSLVSPFHSFYSTIARS